MVVLGQRVTPQVYNLYYSAARPALALQFCHQKFARSEQETDDKGSRIKLTFFFRNFSSSSTYIIIIFQRKYLGKSILIMMMSTLLTAHGDLNFQNPRRALLKLFMMGGREEKSFFMARSSAIKREN